MKILFYRNTHDKDGNYRGDAYFGKTVENTNEFEKQELFFGVHTFEGNKGMTFEEIYNSTFRMIMDGSYDGEIDIYDERLSIPSHLRGLAFMIEHRLVRADFSYETTTS
jgi:hypothetical protein